jgi:RimJ/RimL family protein N-acetyltransferase
MQFPEVLETERLTLRRPRASDAGPISLYAGDKRVAEMLESVPHPYPPGAAEAFIATSLKPDAVEHVWVMDALKIDGPEFVGVIGVRRTDGVPRIGYWVGPPFWNTGYASEAAKAVIAAAKVAGVEAVEARIVAGNEASGHVLTNAGFRETGTGEFYGVAAGKMLEHRLFTLVFDTVAA